MITLVTAKEARDRGVNLLYDRGEVLVLGDDLDDANIWQVAHMAGATHVLFLPDAAPWLVGRITEMAEE